MIKNITSLEPLKILLVEDSKTDAILIERVISQAAPNTYRVQRAENLTSALEILGENEFDVVLLDLTLPDTVEFSGLLSIQNMAPKLPVIILTAHADEETALRAVEHGAQDYLFKDKANGHVIKRSMQYAIQRKHFEGVLITQANFDPLTGLANRILFESRLDMAIARSKRSGAGIGVFFLDLDHFKHVNDSLGHAAGDQLLQQVAARLKQSVRSYDTAARFGGDEFALIVEGVAQARDCAVIAQKILQIMAEPFAIASKHVDVSISIGIATCVAGENLTRDDLMQHADGAMYGAKLAPHSDYRFYTTEVHEQALARLKLEADLCAALKTDELELYYQPKLDLRTGHVTGAEAFIRWNHPSRGLLLPGEFIAVAEETGQMGALGQWVLSNVCKDMERWQKSELPMMQIAVNLSGIQLDDVLFPQWIAVLLGEHAIACRWLILEVTSSSLLDRMEARLQTLAALEKLGIAIHLDHFGTNAVSLSALQAMKLDALKIDSVVMQTLGLEKKTSSLIQAIIAMAHKLNLKVIASGVENEWQQAYLKDQQCDQAQGIVFSRPMPGDYFTEWLQDKNISVNPDKANSSMAKAI